MRVSEKCHPGFGCGIEPRSSCTEGMCATNVPLHIHNSLVFLNLFIGIDLALMMQANHSIMSYGTFGMWGALLAGGQVTVPNTHYYEGSIQYIVQANLTNFVFI
jgi:hypothetical protein